MTSRDERERLRHHGDVDAAPDLLDFAVNVLRDGPPEWLRKRLAAGLDQLGRYPSEVEMREARLAAAHRHGRDPDHVVILNGASEGFALLPALRPRLAAVVHPSFTEPELVLRDADVPVTRVQLDPADGYRLRPELVPDAADLVVLGNPTNPTSVAHPASVLRQLLRPGRVVVVDEAFADTMPGEPESLAGADLPGLLVVRSLTKMWGLPGLRAGYALGRPELLAELTHGRPHWPLGSLTLEAVRACCTPEAIAEAEQLARKCAAQRESLTAALHEIPGVAVHEPAVAPFLLLRIGDGAEVRAQLRERGIAVRRADTFPGLGPDHLRIAVRSSRANARLLAALRAIVAEQPGSTRTGVAV